MRRKESWNRFGRGKINTFCTCAHWQSPVMHAEKRGSMSAMVKSCCAKRCSLAQRSHPCSGATRRRFRCRTRLRSIRPMPNSSSMPRRSCIRRDLSLPCAYRKCVCGSGCGTSSCWRVCRIPAMSAPSSARRTPSAWTPWCLPVRVPISTVPRPCAPRWARSSASRC